ncbi:uncharacterized protein LOC144728168 [Lampetra planeri]
MSKHLKKRNSPDPLMDADVDTGDDELQDAAVPLLTPAALPGAAPTGRAGVEATPPAEEGWRHVADQIESLPAVMLNLLTVVASSVTMGRPRETGPYADDLGLQQGVAIRTAATTPAAREGAAILNELRVAPAAAILNKPRVAPAATILNEPRVAPAATILNKPRAAGVAGASPPKVDSGGRSHRFPTIKEFVAGGDWNAITWRFESAFRSVRWSESEALETLPALLDDASLAVFRSIPVSKKMTLKDACAEMAEFYDPPSAAHWKFLQRRRGPEESPLAYRGVLVALTMAAYPDSSTDLLDPLSLTRMLELSQELAISLPVCGHEPMTSRWVARCFDAKFNLRRWDQMAAWTGDPKKNGQPFGWTPRQAVQMPDDSSGDDLVAAAPRWTPQRRQGMPRGGAGRPRVGAEATDRRAAATCFKCGHVGHFARDCRRRCQPPQLQSTRPLSSSPDTEWHPSRASQRTAGTRHVPPPQASTHLP